MDEFELELKNAFIDEASQGIEDAEETFLLLESNSSDSALLDKIFRLAHNLKGSARAVGFEKLGEFMHVFENLLIKIKNKEIEPNAEVVSLLLKCNDHSKNFVAELRSDLNFQIDASTIISEIETFISHSGKNLADTSATAETSTPAVEMSAESHVGTTHTEGLKILSQDVAPGGSKTGLFTKGGPDRRYCKSNYQEPYKRWISKSRLSAVFHFC